MRHYGGGVMLVLKSKRGIAALVTAGVIALAHQPLLDFLERWEGRRYTVYEDKLAGGLPTVCKGITPWTSPYPVVVGERWSNAKCNEVERQVVATTQKRLAECLTNMTVTQNVFDALTSLAHNIGVERVCTSTAVYHINRGDIQQGCEAIAHRANGKPNWSYANGRFVQGLYNRRLAERKMCLGL